MRFYEYQSVMNDTKWEEIRNAMNDCSINTIWRTQDVKTKYISDWDGDWFYHFKDSYKNIEWLEIKVENLEEKNQVINTLRKINVPGEAKDDVIKVYGYVQNNNFIDYL
ncbi:hypothetical protein COM86_25130 [Priestia megaterium]|jgi:hypothetical protein|uniref:DUF6678 family protein n=1 Tax=Priestia megaterium TaxID=1404 RepID=UPI000BEDFF29|nr:DUF6678 family protein [Priestia megaterium]PEB61268.1 hypothetical protein COM86_25130 [Priestia megaterium]PEE77682.1 hypothetical protein COM81_06230 [Priestia megaterium]PFI91845.1 hypothetical protein COI84_20715 [Priestia megaterium]PGR15644.1 hypothetical protein COC62_02615 [Priestia megaterium]